MFYSKKQQSETKKQNKKRNKTEKWYEFVIERLFLFRFRLVGIVFA